MRSQFVFHHKKPKLQAWNPCPCGKAQESNGEEHFPGHRDHWESAATVTHKEKDTNILPATARWASHLPNCRIPSAIPYFKRALQRKRIKTSWIKLSHGGLKECKDICPGLRIRLPRSTGLFSVNFTSLPNSDNSKVTRNSSAVEMKKRGEKIRTLRSRHGVAG